jgi:hypothetical protein
MKIAISGKHGIGKTLPAVFTPRAYLFSSYPAADANINPPVKRDSPNLEKLLPVSHHSNPSFSPADIKAADYAT